MKKQRLAASISDTKSNKTETKSAPMQVENELNFSGTEVQENDNYTMDDQIDEALVESITSFGVVSPLIIPATFINLTTNPNDLVIDGFNGTASTGAACKVLGRNYVGFELNKNYLEVSQVRLKMVEDELAEQQFNMAA